MKKIKLTKKHPQKEIKDCTRIEVVDENGRAYVNWKENNKITISMQDDFKTMKIFVTQN